MVIFAPAAPNARLPGLPGFHVKFQSVLDSSERPDFIAPSFGYEDVRRCPPGES